MGRFYEQWVSSQGDGDVMMSIMVSSFIWKVPEGTKGVVVVVVVGLARQRWSSLRIEVIEMGKRRDNRARD